jgi:OmpA-OmpF porin, OOP family
MRATILLSCLFLLPTMAVGYPASGAAQDDEGETERAPETGEEAPPEDDGSEDEDVADDAPTDVEDPEDADETSEEEGGTPAAEGPAEDEPDAPPTEEGELPREPDEPAEREALPGDVGPEPTLRAPFIIDLAVPDEEAPEEPEEAVTPRPHRPPVDLAEARRERRHVLHNSWHGSVGGFRVVDAGSGAPEVFRVLMAMRMGFYGSWLEPDESHRHMGGVFAWSWTPWRFMELYANTNVWSDSNFDLDGRFQVLSDLTIGAKAFHWARPWLALGGDVSAHTFLNTTTALQRTGRAAGGRFRGNMSVDLRELEGREGRVPFIARFNVGYTFDNSANMVSGLEQDRYDALPTDGPDARRPVGEETRHLLTRAERFGMQVDRRDRVTFGVGFEVPFEIESIRTTVSPIAEWVLDLPVNRQGFVCPDGGADGCLVEEGFPAYRQSLLVGVRVMPWLRGLSLQIAGEVGLTGVRTHVHELAPQAPYSIMIGLSYAHDYRADPSER